jgi:hypothetical protein
MPPQPRVGPEVEGEAASGQEAGLNQRQSGEDTWQPAVEWHAPSRLRATLLDTSLSLKSIDTTGVVTDNEVIRQGLVED